MPARGLEETRRQGDHIFGKCFFILGFYLDEAALLMVMIIIILITLLSVNRCSCDTFISEVFFFLFTDVILHCIIPRV